MKKLTEEANRLDDTASLKDQHKKRRRMTELRYMLTSFVIVNIFFT